MERKDPLGRQLVLGGPGTGKTTYLERRFLSLAEEGVPAHRILLLCTNRSYAMAAKDRLVWRLKDDATIEVPVYTWHALAYHLVSRYYPSLGFNDSPVLLTAPEQWGTVRELLAAEHPVDWPVWGDRLKERGFVDEIADFCLRAQQRLMLKEDLDALARHRTDWAEVISFYSRYLEHLKVASRVDYAGLLRVAFELLEKDAGVRAAMKHRFPYVMVDDGQDMSHAHRMVLQHLDTTNLVVAADPDSGIETFRGADPEWVYGFSKWFGDHEKVVLGKSHRIGSPLGANTVRLMEVDEPSSEYRPSEFADHETSFDVWTLNSMAEEAESIAKEIRKLHLIDGVAYRDMAILVSQPRALAPVIQRALQTWEVPFRSSSSERPITSEPAVAAFLQLVQVALNPSSSQEALVSLLSSSVVGLDHGVRRKLERRAWSERRSLIDVVSEAEESAELQRLIDVVVKYQDRADECFWHVYNEGPYYARLTGAALEGDPESAEQLDSLVAFSHGLGRFVERRHGRGSISQYLEEAARADFGTDPWLPPIGRGDGEGVSILTFHGARGMQWHTVFVAGCLDAWMPKGRRAQGLFDPFSLETPDPVEREVEAIAIDRRTFYVAATRATSRSVFTVSPGPSGRMRPSRFLTDLLGSPPAQREVEPQENGSVLTSSPLTLTQMRASLRRALSTGGLSPGESVAAVIALSETPGADPSAWPGRWRWTTGAEPLARYGEFRTSYSRLDAYRNCGLQYVLQSVLGLDPSSSQAMKFGTWMHALFEAVHDGRIRDPKGLLAEYNRLFDESIFPNLTIARQYRRDGERMLETFWNYEVKPYTVLTEHQFKFDYEGAVLRGRIDRIDKRGDALKLVDYKTSKWAASKREGEESLQLAIYYLAARNDPEIAELGEPQLARLVYPGATWPEGRPKEAVQNAEQADKVIEGLPTIIQKVLDEDFSPSPHADCFYCRMKPLCPLWPEGKEAT